MRLIDPIRLKQALAVSAILEDKKTIEQIIDEQPTIELERKTGKWIKMADADGSFTACSECGEWWFNCETNYCPTCGVRMKKDGTTEVNVVRTWKQKETK